MSATTDDKDSKEAKEDTKSKTPRSGKCDMCLSTKKEIKTQCQKCDHFLCGGCNASHKRIPACKDHQVKTLADIVTSYKPRMRNMVNDLEQEKAKVEKSMQDLKKSTKGLQEATKKQQKEVSKLTESATNDLKEYEKRNHKLIAETNEKIIKQLQKTEENLKKINDEFERKISYLKEGVESEELTTIAKISKSMDGKFKDEVSKIKRSIPAVQSNYKSPVTISRGDGWAPERCTVVTIN